MRAEEKEIDVAGHGGEKGVCEGAGEANAKGCGWRRRALKRVREGVEERTAF